MCQPIRCFIAFIFFFSLFLIFMDGFLNVTACFNFIVLCSCFVYCLYMYISYVGFKSSLELVLYIVSFLPTLNNISYLGVIKGVQNFTPVLKIHTPVILVQSGCLHQSGVHQSGISYICCA